MAGNERASLVVTLAGAQNRTYRCSNIRWIANSPGQSIYTVPASGTVPAMTKPSEAWDETGLHIEQAEQLTSGVR